mgnify:CR=1 FL=1
MSTVNNSKKRFLPHVGIRTKTVVGLGALVLISCLAIGFTTYRENYELSIKQLLEKSTISLQSEAKEVGALLEKYNGDLRAIGNLPMLQGSIQARDHGGTHPERNLSLEFIHDRMAEILKARVASDDDYVMIRFFDEYGLELVRVERVDSGIEVVAREELQDKSHRHFFQESIRRLEGQIYIEDINLRREHSKLLYPPAPVLRLGLPVYDQGRVRGVVLTDIKAERLFTLGMHGFGEQRYVVDHLGHILSHPDSSKTFGFELGFNYSVADIMAELPEQLESNDFLIDFHQADHQIEGFAKVFFDPMDQSRYWALFHTITEDVALAGIYSTQKTVVTMILVLTLFSLLMVTWFVNRKILRPLTTLARHATQLKSGDLAIRLDTSTIEDEFRGIYLAVNELVEHQQNSLSTFEKKLAQQTQELSMVNARMQALVDSAPDAILSIRADDRSIVLFSRGAEKMFGYSAAEVLGRNINILMPEPFHSHHEDFVKNYMRTGQRKIIGIIREVRAKKKDGTIFDIDLSVSEAKLKEGHLFMGIIRDISARVQAAKEIESKTLELEVSSSYERSFGQAMALFSSSYQKDVILKGTLALLSKSHPFPVSALYVYDEWSGNLICEATHGVSADKLKQNYQLGEGLIGQAGTQEEAIVINKKDLAKDIWIDAGIASVEPAALLLTPIRYQEKRLGVLALLSLEPLTDQDCYFIDRLCSQIGVSLHNLNQYSNLKDLSEQLKIRGKEISRQNNELAEANKMKSEFLATMSHELRTPLNAIIGFSEILKDGLLGDLAPEQTDYVSDIFNSGHHLLDLINDILDLSKIEAGKMELELETIEVRSLLENSLIIVKEKAFAHQIQLKLEIEGEVGDITVDARKMKQVIYNLLSNAVKFTPDQGDITMTAQRVLVDTRPFLEIAVTDSGIGISESDQKKLFQPFQQVDQSLAKKFEGTGLGLAMVKRLAELHGGSVELKSELGQGSCFTVRVPYGATLPTASKSSRRQVTTPVPTQNHMGERLALVVEDDPKAAEMIRIQLDQEGFKVQLATNAEQGLELARAMHPDLITLDILLPGMSGWKFMEAIKKEAVLSSIPVIIISIVADQKKGLALGANKILQKPIDRQDLYAALSGLGFDHRDDQSPWQVLVVDDDPKAVALIRKSLEAVNCQVLEAFGGSDAITLATSHLPNLIILDLMMPEVTGFDVVAALRENPETARIPICILSAKILTQDEKQFLDDNITQVLQKSSFSSKNFVSEIHRVMRTRVPILPGIPDLPAGPGPGSKQPLILVVEDKPNESELLKLYFESAGYLVEQAMNGREALDKMAIRRPDLITLDLMMPEMDGMTFLDQKGAHAEFDTIPVAIISANGPELTGTPLGAQAILGKPIRRQALLELAQKFVGTPGHEGRPKVLVVDDDPQAIKIISSYLDEKRYEIHKASGGEEGLEIARDNLPDLIILDLMMPEMDGFEVLDHLQEDERTNQIPVVILTAKLLNQQERDLLQDKVAAIASKSNFTSDGLLKKIELLLKEQ